MAGLLFHILLGIHQKAVSVGLLALLRGVLLGIISWRAEGVTSWTLDTTAKAVEHLPTWAAG